jgi:TolA-binding protein
VIAGSALWIHASLKLGPPSTPPPAPSSAATADASSALSLPDELPASGAQSEEDRTAYREAIRALRCGDLESAIQELDATIKRSPDFAGAIEAAKELGIDIEPRGSINGNPTELDASTLVGSLLLSADRLDEAEKLLRIATNRCAVAPDQSARLALANLLARRGDKAEACATYAVIEKGWGNAKPRSVTAEAGRAAARKLGCAPKP